MPTELKGFNLKKAWTNNYAENETWSCKFNQKAGYHKCGNVVKLEYLSHSAEVVVFDNQEEHRHEMDLDYVTGGKKYLWSKVQEDILLPLARNKLSAIVCLRELQKKNAPNSRGIYPTITHQLQEKVHVSEAGHGEAGHA